MIKIISTLFLTSLMAFTSLCYAKSKDVEYIVTVDDVEVKSVEIPIIEINDIEFNKLASLLTELYVKNTFNHIFYYNLNSEDRFFLEKNNIGIAVENEQYKLTQYYYLIYRYIELSKADHGTPLYQEYREILKLFNNREFDKLQERLLNLYEKKYRFYISNPKP